MRLETWAPAAMLPVMAIRDWPSDERPREKLLGKGAAALSDAELLAILLRTGTRGRSALDLARDVLKNFNSLRQADRGRSAEILRRAWTWDSRASRNCRPRPRSPEGSCRRPCAPALRSASPRATRDFSASQLRDLEHEVFCCLYLDKRHRLIQFQELFRGTIDGASVHPREIVKLALQRNAAAVIIAHNHPSRRRRAEPGGRTHHPAGQGGAGAGGHTPAGSHHRRRRRDACRWRNVDFSRRTRSIANFWRDSGSVRHTG